MTDGELPLVSIGFPTYNRAEGYLETALACMLDQDYPNLEIVISDNCSTDNTEQVVRSFDDKRITYVRQPQNIGAIANFNFCLENSNGVYFLLFHDDDLIDKNLISECMSRYNPLEPVSMIRTGARIIDGKGNLIREEKNLSTTTDFYQTWTAWSEGKTSFYLCSTLFHRKHLIEVGGFLPSAHHVCDIAAAVNSSSKASVTNLASCMASFRVHAGELTHTPNMQSWCDSSLELITQFELHSKDEQFSKDIKAFVIRMACKRCMNITSIYKRYGALLYVSKRFDSVPGPTMYVLNYYAGRLKAKMKLSA